MTRAVITCSEPGCHRKISYDPDKDFMVHLYCEAHRTITGRHAAIRELRVKEPEKPEKRILFKCPDKTCRKSDTLSFMEFVSGKRPLSSCGKEMQYHGDAP